MSIRRLAVAITCAIRGHSWTDYSMDYRPDYTQRFERCHRCQMWTKHERLDPAPWADGYKDLGQQIAMNGGLPRDLRERIEAIEAGR